MAPWIPTNNMLLLGLKTQCTTNMTWAMKEIIYHALQVNQYMVHGPTFQDVIEKK